MDPCNVVVSTKLNLIFYKLVLQSVDYQEQCIVAFNKRTMLVAKIHQVKIIYKAKDIEEFIIGITDGIGIGCCVRYDLASLEYDTASDF